MLASSNCQLIRALVQALSAGHKQFSFHLVILQPELLPRLIWVFKVLKASAEISRPATGCLAYGIFMDGARCSLASCKFSQS